MISYDVLPVRSVKAKLFFSGASNVLAGLDDDDTVTNCEIIPHILLCVSHEIDNDVAQTSFTAIALIDGGPVALLILFITTYMIISYQLLSKFLRYS